MSRYDGSDTYVYPDTEVLRNKADIHDQAGLDAFEADATAVRMLELIENPITGVFDLRHLCALHRYLFQDAEVFVVRLAHYMGEINAAHPFREGNGRVQRLFCTLLADQAGYFIDFATIDQSKMYEVMIASFNGNNAPLVSLLSVITAIVE